MTKPSEALGTEDFEKIKFSVDAHLLSELGERLVGRRHIALAELVKNSYDADAKKVIIKLFSDRIEVHDDGSGMNKKEFRKFWMRIGSSHKREKEHTDVFGRVITGSKGVGRLSVQFLAHELMLKTVSHADTTQELAAFVDWEQAVQVDELNQATVQIVKRQAEETFPNNAKHGTILILSGLKHKWTEDNVRDLARELWMIQPPTRFNIPRNFHIEFVSEIYPEVAKGFSDQIGAVLDLWSAKIRGELLPRDEVLVSKGEEDRRKARITVQFSEDGEVFEYEPVFEDFILSDAEYEIYIYDLRGKQKYGIAVEDARNYMKKYGGVSIYDNGFNLPYYPNC